MSSASLSSDDEAVVVGPEDVRDYNEEQALPLTAEELEHIRRWLKPTPYNAKNGEYHRHLAAHLAGTGDWLCASATYKQWREDDNYGMLWISGIPGSGKSVITASLIQKLKQESPQSPVLFFFFRKIIDANHAPVALVRDWLDQLLDYSPPLQARLNQHVQNGREIESLYFDDLWKILRETISALPRLFLIVDGLDEMDQGNDAFLEKLASVGSMAPSRVKLLVTSRPVASVETPLHRTRILRARLEDELIDNDIRAYVNFRLAESTIPETQYETIKQAVPSRTNDLFLYAKLAMDTFLEEGVTDVNEALERLPVDLNSIYERMLREQAEHSHIPHALQVLLLSWATHASRPLRLVEIAEMLRVVGVAGVEAPKDITTLKQLARTACGPLLEILHDETICVIHHSLTEFLNGSTRRREITSDEYPILSMGSTHSLLAQNCLTYLLHSGCLEAVKVPDVPTECYESELDRFRLDPKIHAEYPFLPYCLESCCYHLRKAEENCEELDEDLLDSVEKLMTGSNWVSLRTLVAGRITTQSPLHLLADWGLSKCLDSFLDCHEFDHDLDLDLADDDDEGDTALMIATQSGQVATVQILLARGADPDKPTKQGGLRPLHVAAMRDNGRIVDLLLAAGVDPLTEAIESGRPNWCGTRLRRTSGQTPLTYAMKGGHRSAAAAFIPHLKEGKHVNRALWWAATGGHEDIVRLVLEHPAARVDAKVHGDTPLFMAAKARHIETVMALLRAGADPTVLSFWAEDEFALTGTDRKLPSQLFKGEEGQFGGFSALHALCGATRNHSDYPANMNEAMENEDVEECVALMIKTGLDIHLKDERGMTAFQYAVQWSPRLVRLLLEAGADAGVLESDKGSLLHATTNPEIAQLLVEKGNLDINQARRLDGQTPLLVAASNKSHPTMKKLLELGANPHATDVKGRGVLHIYLESLGARRPYRPGDSPASPWSPDSIPARIRGSALSDRRDGVDTVQMLLEAGVRPDDQDDKGRTPLHHFVHIDVYPEVAKALVGTEADLLDVLDAQGRTPLLTLVEFVENFDIKTLGLLVKLGARLDAVDDEGCNVLFRYFERRKLNVDVVVRMVQLGADPHARDLEGNTLWHRAVKARSDPTSRLEDSHLTAIRTLGVDVEATNHAGQTALHLLAARPSTDLARGLHLLTSSVNIHDYRGVVPLHIAVRHSEESVTILLGAGAFPDMYNHEGLTPLHVAARFRQPNIVGILLESLKDLFDDGDRGLRAFLNDPLVQAPPVLQMACRAGLPETVALLLAAGAEPGLVDYKGLSPLMWCVQYEEEQALWNFPQPPREAGCKILGIGLSDTRRPREVHQIKGSAGRLEEILDMLYKSGPPPRVVPIGLPDSARTRDFNEKTDLERAISASIGKDYTVVCLLQLWQRLNTDHRPHDKTRAGVGGEASSMTEDAVKSLTEEDPTLDYPLRASLKRHNVALEVFRETKAWQRVEVNSENWNSGSAVWSLNSLLEQHQWDVIKCWSDNDANAFFKKGQHQDEAYMETLILCGLDSLVGQLLTRDKVKQLERQQQAITPDDENYILPPLLNIACRRQHGNVPMLRCLVERLGVDLNQQLTKGGYRYQSKRNIEGQSALHVLASGTYWWQAAEGIPYLVSRGADLNLRDLDGRTPLAYALQRGGVTGRRAARVLIEAGADIDTIDNSGQSCLDLASRDVDMVRLLLDRGAKVTAAAVFAAMEEKREEKKEERGRAELLDLLCQRVSPDIRRPRRLDDDDLGFDNDPDRGRSRRNPSTLVDRHEIYPLYQAAWIMPNKYVYARWDSENDTPVLPAELIAHHLPIIEVLMSRGADPLVTFTKWGGKGESSWASEYAAEEVTLLHDLLEEGGIVGPILELSDPEPDPEHRDARGRTLLLAASRCRAGPDISIDAVHIGSQGLGFNSWERPPLPASLNTGNPSAIECLLDQGASAAAQDNEGKNALHHILETRKQGGYRAMRRLIETEWDLLHQVDHAGETPLHYALRRCEVSGNLDVDAIELLLNAGSDALLPDKDGNTALHCIAAWLSEEQEPEPKGHIQTSSSRTDESPLHRLFKTFLDLGLPINGRNNKGETPLFTYVASQGLEKYREMAGEVERQRAALDLLLSSGSDLYATNDEGDTLLHVAAAPHWRLLDAVGSSEVANIGPVIVDRFQWLVEQGLDPLVKNAKNQTSLEVAAENNNHLVLQLFPDTD